MFTTIDKNLLIAALESALDYAQTSAGVASLEELTSQVHDLRLAFDADPAGVTDDSLNTMIATLQGLEVPDPAQLSRLLTAANVTDGSSYLAVCSWATLLNKPATFPPSAHPHNWSEIAYKPAKFEPKDHRHPWTQLDSIPATFPPATHTHTDLIADWDTLQDKPATFPPAAHTHTDLIADWDTLQDKPASLTALEQTQLRTADPYSINHVPLEYYHANSDSWQPFDSFPLGVLINGYKLECDGSTLYYYPKDEWGNNTWLSKQGHKHDVEFGGMIVLGVIGMQNYWIGWMICDGTAISRTDTYIGLMLTERGCPFGTGDGTTTVNLPNLTAPAGLAYHIYGDFA